MADEPKPPVDLAAIVDGLSARHGGADKALAKLVDENHEYREKVRGLKADLAEAIKAKPADGAVVLSAADATAWAAYQQLGKPADIEAQIAAGTAAITKAATMEREKVVSDAATTLGWKGSVLSELSAHPAKGFAVELREEADPKDASKTVKVPYAKATADEKAAAVPLAAYVADKFADFVPALAASPQQQDGGPRIPAMSPASGGTVAPQPEAHRAALAGSGAGMF